MYQAKTKKTKKIFKSKKELKECLDNLPSDIELQLTFQPKQQRLAFSQMCKDQSIAIRSDFEATVDSQRFRQGQIILNKKLEEFTEWRLKMCGISLTAMFGICQVYNQRRIGNIYGLYSIGYAPNQRYLTGYQFENDTWIKLTYNPQEQSLLFYNEQTKQSYEIQIPEKKDFDYYPYVFLYKATVYLNQEPDSDPYDAEYYDRMYQDHIKACEDEQKRLYQLQVEAREEEDKKLYQQYVEACKQEEQLHQQYMNAYFDKQPESGPYDEQYYHRIYQEHMKACDEEQKSKQQKQK